MGEHYVTVQQGGEEWDGCSLFCLFCPPPPSLLSFFLPALSAVLPSHPFFANYTFFFYISIICLCLCHFFLIDPKSILVYSFFSFSCSVCPFPSLSSCRSVCCTALWRRLSWFSRQPGRRVRPGPVTCGSPWDRPCPAWAWRGCPRPCSPSGRRAGGTSHDGMNSFLFIFMQPQFAWRGFRICCYRTTASKLQAFGSWQAAVLLARPDCHLLYLCKFANIS